MVGANYMGGKRSTARAKSKDIVGRAQRRHFGKQRLASALCATQENRVRPGPSTSSSGLPEITLAHARHHASDSGAAFSRHVFSGDRLYSPTSSSDTTRNKPSKALGALDTLDQDTSMRAAIKCILQQPNLVGISTTDHKGTAYMQPPRLAGRPTDAHLHSKDSHSETISKHVFDPCVGQSQVDRHQPAAVNPNTKFSSTPSPPASLLRTWDTTSMNPFDDTEYAGARLFIEVSHTETQDGWPDTSLDVPVAPRLPRSSPFSSSSQSSDNSILGLDTSPRALIHLGRFDDLSEEDVDFVDASPLRSFHQPTFRQPSRSHPIHQGSAESDEARLTSPSLFSLTENRIEAEQSCTCYNDDRTVSSTRDDSRHSSLAGSGFNSIRNMTNQEVTEDDAPSGIPIDFLSDPHPWETIGRILNLNPPGACAAQSAITHFTKSKDKEGVGYVSPEKLGTCYARSPDAASFATRIDDMSMDDTHGVSDADPPTLDSEVPIVDNRTTIDAGTLNPPYTYSFTRPLRDARLPFIPQAELHPYIHVLTQAQAPSIPVVYCTQNEHTRFSAPHVGTTAVEPDIDVTFDGPCLFGDSDLEEDE